MIRHASHRRGLPVEQLEARCLLAANLLISEFMAANNGMHSDEDGQHSDWIEIYNADSAAVDLADWRLTDDDGDLEKWPFPDTAIEPGEYLVVFASGKDRAVAGGELHTNFKLEKDGEYLALVYDDPISGPTIASEFAGFPAQQADVSYGFEQPYQGAQLVGGASAAEVLVPSSANGGDTLGGAWTQSGFEPTGWTDGSGGVGWDESGDYSPLIGTDVQYEMDGSNATAYVRYPFGGVDAASVHSLQLGIDYDDGFIAYLNGTEIARRNAPLPSTWDSAATVSYPIGDEVVYDYPSFTNLNEFTVNSNIATALPSIANNRLRVTPGLASLANSVFRTNPIAFDPDYYTFSTEMTIELTNPTGSADADGPGADGLVFVLQTDGPNRVGAAGGGLGLDGAFTKYVAIEFDTWSSGSFDPDTLLASHVGINSSAVGGNVARAAVPRFNDGGLRRVWIDYDGVTETMNVYFTSGTTKPAAPTLTSQIDLASIFGGLPQLYAGFTAGTGGATNVHDVVSWKLRVDPLVGIDGATEIIDVSEFRNVLSASSNVLAIHGLNVSADDDFPDTELDRDFLVRPQLAATTVDPLNSAAPRYFTTPTPGSPNGVAASAPVSFSRASGTFVEPFGLSLVASEGAEIRYTVDGSAPTAQSTLYQGSIEVTRSTVVRAIAIEPGFGPSEPTTANYIALGESVANFSSNLPIVVLDSFVPVTLSDRGDLQKYVGAAFIDTGPDGTARITDTADYAGRGGLRLRGQVSQGFPKPHFAYETWTEDNVDVDVPLLGMPGDSDWVLYNPYSEKSLMQNYLPHQWWSDMGRYAVRTRYVEVFANLNGDADLRYDLTAANLGNATRNDYLGIYILMEKIKLENDRVTPLGPTGNTEPEASGSYIYKRDKVSYGDVPWSSSRGIDYRLHDPDDGEVTPPQKAWLVNYINEMESVIYGANFTDPVNGYAKYIDVDSWVDHWIMVEMTKNIDGFRLSTFYTKEADVVDPVTGEVVERGRVTMDPLWDFDLSLGNADYLNGWVPTEWYHSQSNTLNATTGLTEGEYIYFRRLFQDPNFKQKVVDRWQELRASVFTDANMLDDVNDTIDLLTDGHPNPVGSDDPHLWSNPIARNYSRWRTVGVDLWPNWYIGTSWLDDTTWMRDTFLMPRLDWIDAQFVAQPVPNQDGGMVQEGFGLTLSAQPGTSIYYTTDGTDPRIDGSFTPGVPGTTVLAPNAPLKWLVPTSNALGTTWTSQAFNDAAWNGGSGGIGYERAVGYAHVIGTNINDAMASATTFFSRFHFNVADPMSVESLHLLMQYDDGFVTYLNGTEIARSTSVPAGVIAYNATATDIPDSLTPQILNITAFKNLLVAGDNVLAIHGLNSGTGSSDLLIRPEIQINGTPDTIVPAGVSPDAVLYTGPITIDENKRIIARAFRSATSDFSGPFDATFTTQTIPLVVTELNYNPAQPTVAEIAAGFADNDEFEFIELRNVGAAPLALGGMRIADGVTFTFPASTLPAGERVLVVKNSAAFALRYGLGQNVAGVYTGSLANEGEHIQVLGPVGELTMDFTYSDGWHPLTDGGGSSLVIVDDAAAPLTWNDAASWRPSDYMLGSPGGGDASIAPAPDSLQINEVLLDAAGPTGQRIELYNTSSASIDVSGFYLSDTSANLTKYRLPLSLPPIIAGGYLVLNGADTFGTQLPLSPNGGRLILRAADAGGTITGFETSEEFTAADPGVSQGWYIKSTGGHDFTPLATPTLGAENAAPKIGPVVINEFMYHPLVTGDEFIELKNISGAPVSLQDWSFSSGVTYTFGATTLGAGEYLLVVGINPATFRTKYSIPAAVQIVGPYLGNLADDSENLELARPNATDGDIRVDRVNYNTSDLWPVRPQGIGSSLSRIDSAAYANDVVNWGADAPGGSPGQDNTIFDDTPPTVPTGLSATVAPSKQIVLTWSPSFDPQSSVAHYNVYRNSVLHATVTAPTYTDEITDTNVTYVYEVAAVNPSLEASARSAQVSARVLVVASAIPLTETTVRLRFNSVVTATSAQDAANYLVPGLDVLDVTLEAGGNSVLMTTSPHATGQPYRIVVNDVVSTLGAVIQPNSQTVFTAGLAPGLKAEYFNDPNTTAQPNEDSLLPENLVVTRVDANIDTGPAGMHWPAAGSPIPGTVDADYFSVRWTGRIQSLAPGEYRFSIQSSDGIRVWIWPLGEARPATPIINRWINSSFNTFTAPVTLAGDNQYNFQTEYYETTGSASAFVRWGLPGQSNTSVIPASQFTLAVELESNAPQISEVLVASSQWTSSFVEHLEEQGLGDGGIQVPLGGTSSILPWSNLNQVKVRFDSDVIVGPNDLLVGGVSVASYGVENFEYDYATLTATWTLSEPIAFDRAEVALAPTVTDLAYNSIAGPLASVVRVATGDVTGDGTISSADRSSNLAHQFTSIGHANYLASHDLTGDGAINARDLVILQQRFGATLPTAGPSAAASAVLVHRVTANADQSTDARPIRAARTALARREVAAIDRAIGQGTNATAEGSSKLTAIRARRIARAAADVVLSGAGSGA